jgi:hypothetical protein
MHRRRRQTLRDPILDYYAILGVHPTAEDVVIRAAYKALAQRYHPDRFAGSKDEAHRRMSDLTKAYEVLADPVRRPKYDRRRVTYTQSVAASFNGTPKYASPALDPGDPRSATVNRARYRVALSVLMVVVVVLSTFNLYHYSTRLKGWLGTTTPPASTPERTDVRGAAGASSVGAAGAVPDDSSQAASAAKPRNQPISQGSAPVVETAMPKPQPAVPRGPDSAAAPSVREKARAGARTVVVDRPARSSPTPAASEPCRDTVAALGLCSPNMTAQSK